jgi:hypothetical protein
MKKKFKYISVIAVLFLFTFALNSNGEDERCENTCVPNSNSTCSFGTGIPDDPVAFCDGWGNMHRLKPAEP